MSVLNVEDVEKSVTQPSFIKTRSVGTSEGGVWLEHLPSTHKALGPCSRAGESKQTNKQKGQKSMVTVRLSLVHVCCDFRSMAIKGKERCCFQGWRALPTSHR